MSAAVEAIRRLLVEQASGIRYRVKAGPGGVVVVAHHGRQKVGGLIAAKRDPGFFDVEKVEVHGEYERQGIGTSLYHRAARAACDRGHVLRSLDAQRNRNAEALWQAEVRKGLAKRHDGEVWWERWYYYPCEVAGKFTEADDYHGQHRPADRSDAPLHDLTANSIYPADVYDRPGQYVQSPHGWDALPVIQRVRGKPSARVAIYRAVPAGVTEIRKGDWVAVTREYAIHHAKSNLRPPAVVLRARATADQVYTDGNSLAEWGYTGPTVKGRVVYRRKPPKAKDPEAEREKLGKAHLRRGHKRDIVGCPYCDDRAGRA